MKRMIAGFITISILAAAVGSPAQQESTNNSAATASQPRPATITGSARAEVGSPPADSEISAPFADFKQFLCERPPIEFLSVAHSWGPEDTNFSFFEGSLQPRTFYLKHTLFNTSSKQMMTRFTGASHTSMWMVLENGQVQTVSLETNLASNEVRSMTEPFRVEHARFRDLCEQVFALGLLMAKSGSVRWLDSTHFEAESDDTWRRSHWPYPGNISGWLTGQNPEQPESMHYSFAKRPGMNYRADYTYADDGMRPRFIPSKIVVSYTGPRKGQTTVVTIMKIAQLSIGLIDQPTNGFEFSDVISVDPIRLDKAGLVTISNGVARIRIAGEEHLVPSGPPPKQVIRVLNRPGWRIACFVVCILCSCAVVWYILCLRRKHSSESGH